MKRTLVMMVMSLSFLSWTHAADVKDLFDYYNKKEYEKACKVGLRIFNRYKKDSKFLMLYGLSCLKADYIDRLAVPLTGLRKTKAERANASYFATILLQKKLLYHSLLDDVDISGLKLPYTDYILSKVFDMYTRKEYRKENGVYIFHPEDSRNTTYKLYIDRNGTIPKMVIDVYENDHFFKRHRYW